MVFYTYFINTLRVCYCACVLYLHHLDVGTALLDVFLCFCELKEIIGSTGITTTGNKGCITIYILLSCAHVTSCTRYI